MGEQSHPSIFSDSGTCCFPISLRLHLNCVCVTPSSCLRQVLLRGTKCLHPIRQIAELSTPAHFTPHCTRRHALMPDQFGIYRQTGVFPRKLRKVSIESPILLPVRSFAGHHKARREKQTASGAPSQFVSVYPSPRLKPTGERVASCLLNPRKKRNVKTTGCGFMGVILQTSGLQEVTALSHKQTWPWIVLC